MTESTLPDVPAVGGGDKSPSISSLSSIGSDNSTDSLIKKLSVSKLSLPREEDDEGAANETLNGEHEDELNNALDIKETKLNAVSPEAKQQIQPQTPVEEKVMSPLTPTVDTPPTPELPLVNDKPRKKAIKFTVRKVSHEPIKSPTTSSKPVLANSFHKNNHDLVAENKEKKEKLKLAQAKYEQYQSRITKIDKEVDFLTNLLPPYNVEIDYATRTKITKAIGKLRMKQDELDKKKYSMGIAISRLWRDHDDSDIWVRNSSS